MKIGIIAPSPIPFQMGGAERLWADLRRFINESTAHSAEVVKLPVSEASFWSLIQGYRDFQQLDVSGFDLVITGKYPAWMIEHPNHTVYMLHACRGLYEFYQGPTELTEVERSDADIVRVWSEFDRFPTTASAAKSLLDTLAAWAESPEKMSAIQWPGPFARRVIRHLDRVALSHDRVKRFAAISKTVAARSEYFPDSVIVAVAHPPSAIVSRIEPPTLQPNVPSGDAVPDTPYFFTSSRLDANKRTAAIVRSFMQVRGNIELRIAGEGPEFAAIETLVKPDQRVKLLGRVSDEALARGYANCVAVPFIPYSEDYGLVAIEALGYGKPLLTFSDSGGAAEINIDGMTGITVEPKEPLLTQAMQRFVDDPQLAATYQSAARLRARQANWPKVLHAVTGEVCATTSRTHLPKLVVALTWSFFPPTAGGQVRVFHVYKNLAAWFNIAIVCLVPSHEPYSDVEVAPGLREIRVPKSPLHDRRDKDAEQQALKPVYDITAGLYIADTPEFISTLRSECSGAYAAIASHPYFAPLIGEVFAGPLWYEAHNVEYDLKAQILSAKFPLRGELLKFTREAEEHACQQAEQIWTCSVGDAEQLQKLYPTAKNKCIVVPNCTDVESFKFCSSSDRRAQRVKLLATEDRKIALFLGSGHDPNIEAVQTIFKVASQTPRIIYAIIGTVCYAFDPQQKPANVWFLGQLSETERRVMMEIADVALNPMTRGSGTSLKMLDYMASGMPVVSTYTGSRGIGLEDGVSYFNCENDQLPVFLTNFNPDSKEVGLVVDNARALVERDYSWERNMLKLMSESVRL